MLPWRERLAVRGLLAGVPSAHNERPPPNRGLCKKSRDRTMLFQARVKGSFTEGSHLDNVVWRSPKE